MAYYLDTSALVKRYAREQGTAWITTLTDPIQCHDLYTIQLTGPEMIAALFRKLRTGAITPADAMHAASDFRQDWQTQYLVLNITEALIERAMNLAIAAPAIDHGQDLDDLAPHTVGDDVGGRTISLREWLI